MASTCTNSGDKQGSAQSLGSEKNDKQQRVIKLVIERCSCASNTPSLIALDSYPKYLFRAQRSTCCRDMYHGVFHYRYYILVRERSVSKFYLIVPVFLRECRRQLINCRTRTQKSMQVARRLRQRCHDVGAKVGAPAPAHYLMTQPYEPWRHAT